MNRTIGIIGFLLLSVMVLKAQVFHTQVFSDDVATLRVQYSPELATGGYLSRPMLTLNGNEVLDISFDQLSHEVHYYSYTLRHLDENWQSDGSAPQDYLMGDISSEITDATPSFNTQQLYTHYRFDFPNEYMRPTISGNYVLLIYEDNDLEKVVATACFQVSEKVASIQANVRSNTDIELSGRYQQLDVEVNLSNGLSAFSAPVSMLVVEQNNRTDNRVTSPKPTYSDAQHLRWQNCRSLIFEGGNEYRRIDLSSEYFKGQGVNHIYFDHAAVEGSYRTSGYHAYLFDSELRNDHYLYDTDANGRYVINRERTDDDDTDADYMWVHWTLPADSWMDGGLYLIGDLFDNCLSAQTRMHYDESLHAYVFSAYLKQGGYEWLYAFYNTKSGRPASLERVEGSYWQTHNTYRLSYYFRGVGDRYTRLLAVEDVEN